MASSLPRSGYATLEYEIAQEKASSLGRAGRQLEAALAALAACPRTASSDRETPDRKKRDRLVAQAGHALWLLVVQREACGINGSAQVVHDYGVPREVVARMEPLASNAGTAG
jgi:hypothetical protein